MPSDVNSDSDLCLSCGLCCSGLLHLHALLEREEVASARALGLEVAGEGKPVFSLPCTRFNGRCTIYEDRPHSCRTFRCALLQRLDSGDTSFQSATSVVSEARRLIDQARAAVHPGRLVTEFRRQLREEREGLSAGPFDERRLRLTALGVFLDKHFVRAKDGSFYGSRLVGDRTEDEMGHGG